MKNTLIEYISQRIVRYTQYETKHPKFNESWQFIIFIYANLANDYHYPGQFLLKLDVLREFCAQDSFTVQKNFNKDCQAMDFLTPYSTKTYCIPIDYHQQFCTEYAVATRLIHHQPTTGLSDDMRKKHNQLKKRLAKLPTVVTSDQVKLKILHAILKERPISAPERTARLHNVGFWSQVSDYPLRKTIDVSHYAHCQLKSVVGIPADHNRIPLTEGWYMYVVFPDQTLRVLPNLNANNTFEPFKKFRAHNQLAGNSPLIAAGNFHLTQTTIDMIDGGSGHYNTKQKHTIMLAIIALQRMGLDTSNTTIAERKNLTVHNQLQRLNRKTKAMLWGILLDGKRAENRPDETLAGPYWSSRIPNY